jgi:hypothetical protein
MYPFDLSNVILSRISSRRATIAVDAQRNEEEQIIDPLRADAEPPMAGWKSSPVRSDRN